MRMPIRTGIYPMSWSQWENDTSRMLSPFLAPPKVLSIPLFWSTHNRFYRNNHTRKPSLYPIPNFKARYCFLEIIFSSVAKFLQCLSRIPRLFVGLNVRRPFLLYIHGFTVPPETVLEKAAQYNARPNRAYNVIPVIWDTTQQPTAYLDDRKTLAPLASELFAQSFGRLMNLFTVFMRFGPTKCLMCHSMGNYVLQGFGQSHRDIFAPFDHIFMVAPDVREDLFDVGTNNYNPSVRQLIPKYFQVGMNHLRKAYDPNSTVDTNFDAFANPGKNIASMAQYKVHVLWSQKDKALLFRRFAHKFLRKFKRATRNVLLRIRHFLHRDEGEESIILDPMLSMFEKEVRQRKGGFWLNKGLRHLLKRSRVGRPVRKFLRGWARNIWQVQPPFLLENPPTTALGANGDRQDRIHDDLKHKIVFFNFDEYNNHCPLRHNYQWSEEAIRYYESVLD